MLSIAASVLAAHDDTRVTLLYGNRRTDTVMFTEELADLKNAYGPRLQLIHALSREPMAAEISSGRLTAERLRAHPRRARRRRGRRPVVAVRTARHDHRRPRGAARTRASRPQQVHRELFYVDEPPPEIVRAEPGVEGATSEVTIVLDGRSTTLTLPRSEPVLDAAQHVRADLPFACKGGVCGTCRARVTDG